MEPRDVELLEELLGNEEKHFAPEVRAMHECGFLDWSQPPFDEFNVEPTPLDQD